MLSAIKNRIRAFARDTAGNVTIETVIWVPLIIGVLAATFSLHDAFRQKSLNTKAAFTISDALSRETDPVNYAYLDGMLELLEYLTNSDGPYSLRVTSVRYRASNDKYVVDWSKTRGSFDQLVNRDLANMRDQLPQLLNNERVIVVETATDYNPTFEIPALQPQQFYNFVFTRPRFAPQLVWDNG